MLSATQLVLPDDAVVYFENNSLNATDYEWDFGNGETSSDTHPWNAYNEPGNYTIQLIALSDGCPNDTVYYEVNVGMLHLMETTNSLLQLFPNPFSNSITLQGDGLESAQLFDMTGKLVVNNIDLKISNKIEGLEGLRTGLYYIVINHAGKTSQIKLVKE